jgi:hypothetical protein
MSVGRSALVKNSSLLIFKLFETLKNGKIILVAGSLRGWTQKLPPKFKIIKTY